MMMFEQIKKNIDEAGIGYFDLLAAVLNEKINEQEDERIKKTLYEASLKAKDIADFCFASGVCLLLNK